MTFAALAAALAVAASGQELGLRADSGTAVYVNDDSVTVISPWAHVTQRAVGPLSVGAGWKADLISAASVDIVTAATRAYEETRHEATAEILLDWGAVRAETSYTGSTERDTTTHRIAVSGAMDLLKKSLTLSVAYGLGLDRVGTSDEPESLWRDRSSHRLDLTATQVLGPSTVASAAYTFEWLDGFLSSAYRRVPLFPLAQTQWQRSHAQWVAERHPDTRGRNAVTLRVRQAFSPRLFVSGAYRLYADTWAMRSHLGEVFGGADLGAGVVVELGERVYWQSRASFYRGVYTVDRDYITRDRRLSEILASTTTLRLSWHWRWLDLMLLGELRWERFDDVSVLEAEALVPLDATLGAVIEAGLEVSF